MVLTGFVFFVSSLEGTKADSLARYFHLDSLGMDENLLLELVTIR